VKYLLDTNTVSYYLEKHPRVVERLEAVPPADRYLSIITLGELYHGIFNSRQVEKNLLRYRKFFARTKTLPFTPPIAARYGRIKADLQRRGAMIQDNDVWIAAHARSYGWRLYFHIRRHRVTRGGFSCLGSDFPASPIGWHPE
jgi:tRNA(fMet)-specific endonuclease VapC